MRNSPINPTKPVRKIGVRTTQVRGRIRSNQEYESLLERDYLTLLRMEPMVESFITQPVVIPYELQGRPRTYVPDVLVSYKADSQGKRRRKTLVEVKPAQYADHPDDELAAKLAAANLTCESLGWEFRVVTEDHIYTPRLKNSDFLVRYKDRVCMPEGELMLIDRLWLSGGKSTPDKLIHGASRTPHTRAQMLADLWTLVANGVFYIDLDEPLTMNSTVWSLRK